MPPIAYVESSGPSAGDRPDGCSWHFHLGRYPAVGPTKAAKIEDVLYIGFRVDGSWVISPDTSVGFAVRYEFFHSQSALQAFIFFFSVSYFLLHLSSVYQCFLIAGQIFLLNGKIFPVRIEMIQKLPRQLVKVEGGIGLKIWGCHPVGGMFFDDIFY